MIIVNRIENLISGSVNGKPFSVTYDEQKYNTMMDLQKKAGQVTTTAELKAIVEEFSPLTVESYKEIVETASPYLFVNKHNNKYYLKYNDTLSSITLPQELVDRVLQSVEKNIDITPLIKCWVRFLRNPHFSARKAEFFINYISAPYVQMDLAKELMKNGVSEKIAYERATTTQVAITQEGLLVCYKVSREITKKFKLDDDGETVKQVSRYAKTVDADTGEVTIAVPEFAEDRLFEPAIMGQTYDAFLCIPYGMDETSPEAKLGHFIRVGHSHVLDNWDKVDTRDYVSGEPGLHVGGLKYIQGYQSGQDRVTHNVLVDPMDIGAIVGLGTGNDGAMRVRRYFVHSTFESVNKNIYHSSKYAEINDAEYAVMVQEAIEKAKMDAEEAHKLLDEKIAFAR